MATITLKVTIQNGGGGGVMIKIEGKDYEFPQSGEKSIDLVPEYYVATIAGTEPAGTTVTIEICQGNISLRKKDFSDTFYGSMSFTVS